MVPTSEASKVHSILPISSGLIDSGASPRGVLEGDLLKYLATKYPCRHELREFPIGREEFTLIFVPVSNHTKHWEMVPYKQKTFKHAAY